MNGNTANSVMHDSSTNDLVFKTFNGSAVEEIMRIGDHYGVDNRQIILLSGSGMHIGAMQPREAADIAFFVSGAIGSRMSTTKGTAVFGGDVYISGAFHAPSFREKAWFDVTGSHPTGNRFTTTVNFGKKGYDSNRIDVYLNGQHLRTGSSQDYTVNTDSTISFMADLYDGDAITVITF